MDTKFKSFVTCLPLVFIVLMVFSISLSVDRNLDLTVPSSFKEPKPFASLVSLSGTDYTSNSSEMLDATMTEVEEVVFDEEPNVYSGVYQKRIDRVHQVCLEKNLNTNRTSKHNFFISKKHRLVAKPVAKVGTTTFITTFHILNDKDSGKVLLKSRMNLHGASVPQTKMDDATLKKYTIIFPSRNPYTRLYSAFIDKVYIFNSMGLVKSVLKHAGVKEEVSGLRKYEVTFQMFLDYALDQSLSKHILGDHYNTLFNRNTWLCSMEQFFIIKQESFSAEFEYALKAVNVEMKKLEVIKGILYSRRAEISVLTILKTVMQRRKSIVNSMGQSKGEANVIRASVFVLTRLWKSFQIQGYIATKSNFPLEKFLSKSSVTDVDYVLSVFLEDIKQHPLTQSESKQQRQLAMLAAYDDIKDETVKKIQKIYKLDFEAFEYNIIGPE